MNINLKLFIQLAEIFAHFDLSFQDNSEKEQNFIYPSKRMTKIRVPGSWISFHYSLWNIPWLISTWTLQAQCGPGSHLSLFFCPDSEGV